MFPVTSRVPPVVEIVSIVFLSALVQQQPVVAQVVSRQTQKLVEIRAEVVGAGVQPLRYGALELQSQEHQEVSLRANITKTGGVAILVRPGKYNLSVKAGGVLTLSEEIDIDSDKNLGSIVMDTDPNVIMAPSAVCCNGSAIGQEPDASMIPLSKPTWTLRGRIEPASLFSGNHLWVQLSCSEKLPGMPERPQFDVARFPLDGTNAFAIPVPPCSGATLAHRELRAALKDEDGKTVALLLPRATASGYYQSKIGIWLPLKPVIEATLHEATFIPEFTDNRPLRANLSIKPVNGPFRVGEMVFLQATLTNTSDEALTTSLSSSEPLSELAWNITDDTGQAVPFHLLRDRTEEPLRTHSMDRSHLLFPGESETYGVNVGFLFDLTSPGTYHAVVRKVVRRPEVPGEEQISSEPSVFVIVGK